MGTTPRPGSGPHQAVSKNGKDQAQDQRIRDLDTKFDHFVEHKFEPFTKSDLDSHSKLYEVIHKIETHFGRAVERLEGKINAHKMVVVAAWVIIALVGTWAVDRASTVFDDLVEKVQAIDTRTQINQVNGADMRDHHDKDMDRVYNQIGRLRKGKPLQEESE